MGKKIIVLNGSPRANGNTSAMADAFIEGAKSAGHEIKRFDLQKMNIHPCIGCLGGGKNPESPCTQKDDMDEIYKVYREADIVIFASPMYYWSVTAQLKAVIDRLFAVTEMDPDYKAPYKECALLMPAGDDDEDNFAPVVDYFNSLQRHIGWKNLGIVFAGGVMEVGDIAGKSELEKTRAFGASLK